MFAKFSFWPRAGAALLGLWCFVGIAHAQQGCKPVALPLGAQGPNLCYGKEVWREPTLGNAWLAQNFDFYRAPSSAPTPLIIWAHPNGRSKALPPDSRMYQALVAPALHAGFSFASIEFRHPVTNEQEADSPTNPGVPHHDVARALQFIRANAEALGIDKRNVFFVGQSRGTLAIWTALQDDMALPNSPDPVARESTRVNAIYGMKAQTTYDGIEFADLFVAASDRDQVVADFVAEHPRHAQFGSAIRSVSAGAQPDPPVRLIYDAPVVPRLVTYAEMQQMDSIHYPNFGPALCQAYLRAFGNSARCSYDADARYKDDMLAYAGYIAFFKAHLYRPQTRPFPTQRVPTPPQAIKRTSRRPTPVSSGIGVGRSGIR